MKPLRFFWTRLAKAGKRTLRARAYAEVADITKSSRHRKAVAPNAELLYPLRLFADFSFSGDGTVETREPPAEVSMQSIFDGTSKLTFAGVLRAMIALRSRYPEAYKFFVRCAQLFSVQLDSIFKVPPTHYLYHRTVDYYVKVWDLLQEEFGYEQREFLKALARFAREYPDIFSRVAVHSPYPDRDEEFVARAERGELPPPSSGGIPAGSGDEQHAPTLSVVVRADVYKLFKGEDGDRR